MPERKVPESGVSIDPYRPSLAVRPEHIQEGCRPGRQHIGTVVPNGPPAAGHGWRTVPPRRKGSAEPRSTRESRDRHDPTRMLGVRKPVLQYSSFSNAIPALSYYSGNSAGPLRRPTGSGARPTCTLLRRSWRPSQNEVLSAAGQALRHPGSGRGSRQAQDFQVSWKMVRTVPRVESIVIRLVPLDEPGLTRSSVLMLNRLSRPHGA